MDLLSENMLKSFSEKGYAVRDNFLSPDEVSAARGKLMILREEKKFKEAGIGSRYALQTDRSVRGDQIFWLEEQDELFGGLFFSKISGLMSELNRNFYLGLRSSEF